MVTATPAIVMRNAKQIAAASDHSLVLTTDDKVYGWGTNPDGALYCAGDNSMGQCAAGRTGRFEAFVAMPVPDLAGRVVAIKAGGFHTLLLTSNGTLHAVGRGRDGQLGHGKTVNGAGAVRASSRTWSRSTPACGTAPPRARTAASKRESAGGHA